MKTYYFLLEIIIISVPNINTTYFTTSAQKLQINLHIILHNNPPLKMMKPKKEKIELYVASKVLSHT